MKDMIAHAKSADLPSNMKIVLTGGGRVGMGAHELLTALGLREVHANAFLNEDFHEAVFTRLDVEDYNARNDGGAFSMDEFISDPTGFKSTFAPYARVADMYIAGHYWAEGSPFLFTRDDMKAADWAVKVVADVSCDIDGPVACTLRPSTIADPLYGYDPATRVRVRIQRPQRRHRHGGGQPPLRVAARREPRVWQGDDAHVIPLLVGGDRDQMLTNATETTLDGALAP